MSKLYYDDELLRELCLAFGPTGCEDNVADIIKSQTEDFCDEMKLDKMGNLTVVLYGKNHGTENERRMMFSAHMDEVGFMITNVNGDGTLKFSNLGGIVGYALPARAVTVGDENNKIAGVIGTKAIHQLDGGERESMPKTSGLYIDIGAKDKDEAEAYVKRGAFAAFRSDFVRFGADGKYIKCKAIDDRFGCAVLVTVCREMYESNERPDHDTIFAFTVREEVGKSGAMTTAFDRDPHMAFVLEATAVADNTGSPVEARVAELGEGPAISFMDRSTIYSREMFDLVMNTAREYGVKCQPKRYVSGGNDAGHIHKTRAGIPTAAISAPARYIHTASNVIHYDDFKSTIALCAAIAEHVEPQAAVRLY